MPMTIDVTFTVVPPHGARWDQKLADGIAYDGHLQDARVFEAANDPLPPGVAFDIEHVSVDVPQPRNVQEQRKKPFSVVVRVNVACPHGTHLRNISPLVRTAYENNFFRAASVRHLQPTIESIVQIA